MSAWRTWMLGGVVGTVVACGRQAPPPISATTVSGPDGTRDWAVVTCSATPDCYNAAAVNCGGPYQIADSSERSGDAHYVGSVQRVGDTYVASGRSRSSSTREMLVHCEKGRRPPPAPLAPDEADTDTPQ